MGAFTNSRVVPLGKDGKPVDVQEYKSDIKDISRPLAELAKLFEEKEKEQIKK